MPQKCLWNPSPHSAPPFKDIYPRLQTAVRYIHSAVSGVCHPYCNLRQNQRRTNLETRPEGSYSSRHVSSYQVIQRPTPRTLHVPTGRKTNPGRPHLPVLSVCIWPIVRLLPIATSSGSQGTQQEDIQTETTDFHLPKLLHPPRGIDMEQSPRRHRQLQR